LDDQTQKPIRLGIDPDAEEYDMNHKRRGVALILNHVNFESMATRKGSVMDSLNLKASLGKLGFDVRIYTDPTIKTITATLQASKYHDPASRPAAVSRIFPHTRITWMNRTSAHDERGLANV
jgi:caspase-like apoptosis-related cysteine protease